MDFLIGRDIGPYKIDARLGAGGMGIVYCAVHRGLNTPRAVKILPMNLASDVTFVARFQREARLAVRLRHPNIVQIYDIGEADGMHYIAMELLEGRSLREMISTSRHLPIEEVLNLVRQLASALDFAHASGVAHRDVKPANAFIGPTGHLTLVDFGIARAAEESKLTATGAIIGTPEYMSPEQAEVGESSPSADLYALGVVAFELLTGRVPFTGSTTMSILRQHIEATPPSPRSFRAELPEAMERVVLRQLAMQPADRFATGRAFVNALTNTAVEASAAQTPTSARAESTVVRPAARLASDSVPVAEAPPRRYPRAVGLAHRRGRNRDPDLVPEPYPLKTSTSNETGSPPWPRSS